MTDCSIFAIQFPEEKRNITAYMEKLHEVFTYLSELFAAADPLHVLPACIVGSGLAGAMSMAFGCTLMAPHGGIFVFPVVGNAVMYLAALVVGTVVSAVLLGILKKKVA